MPQKPCRDQTGRSFWDPILTSCYFKVVLRAARVSFPQVFLQTVTCRWQHMTTRIWSGVEVAWVIWGVETELNQTWMILIESWMYMIWSLSFPVFELWEHHCWGPKAEWWALSGHPPSVSQNAHWESWSLCSLSSLSSLSLKEFAWLKFDAMQSAVTWRFSPVTFRFDSVPKRQTKAFDTDMLYAKEVKEKLW